MLGGIRLACVTDGRNEAVPVAASGSAHNLHVATRLSRRMNGRNCREFTTAQSQFDVT